MKQKVEYLKTAGRGSLIPYDYIFDGKGGPEATKPFTSTKSFERAGFEQIGEVMLQDKLFVLHGIDLIFVVEVEEGFKLVYAIYLDADHPMRVMMTQLASSATEAIKLARIYKKENGWYERQ